MPQASATDAVGSHSGCRPARRFLVLSSVLLGLCGLVYHQARVVALTHRDVPRTFLSLSEGLGSYDLRQEWKPRLFSNTLATATTLCFVSGRAELTRQSLQAAVGAYAAAWFAAIGLLLVAWRREQALLFLFGTYAAVSFGYMPGLGDPRVYPWDLPALFFFWAAIVSIDRGHWRYLVALVVVGTGFKETVAVLCVAFLLAPTSIRSRALRFGTAIALCVTLKAAIDVVTANPSPLWTMTTGHESVPGTRLARNLARFREIGPANPFLVNAGTLLAFFFLDSRAQRSVMLKSIAVVFTLGVLTFGLVQEHRIWFEMIPVALYALASWAARSHPGTDRADATGPGPG